jgi:hypothetical protein
MDDDLTAFYSDPVDQDGNVLATVRFSITDSTWGPIKTVKVPNGEIVTDPENTIRVDLGDLDG